jgi:hypothetical protein
MAMVKPNRFAIEPQLEVAPDEVIDLDEVPQESDDDREEGDCIDLIYTRLRDGDEVAARAAIALARSLQEMVHAAQRSNEPALQHWRRVAIVAIDQLGDESGEV